MCTLSVSNVIYHKFSHGAAFYTLNGKNVYVMLESVLCDFAIICLFFFQNNPKQLDQTTRQDGFRFLGLFWKGSNLRLITK